MTIRYPRDKDFSRALEVLHAVFNDEEIVYGAEDYEYELDYLSNVVDGFKSVDAMNMLILSQFEDKDLKDELLEKYIIETSSLMFQDKKEPEEIIREWYRINPRVFSTCEYDEELYESTAKCVVESLQEDEYDIKDLRGKRINRDSQSLLMTFPVEYIVDKLPDEDLPENIITRKGKWTTPEIEYWANSFALLAVVNDLISVDDVKPFIDARDNYEATAGSGIIPWLSQIDDDDVLDLAVEMKELGCLGNAPYRALKSIARNFDIELTDSGKLKPEDRRKADEIFNNLCGD